MLDQCSGTRIPRMRGNSFNTAALFVGVMGNSERFLNRPNETGHVFSAPDHRFKRWKVGNRRTDHRSSRRKIFVQS